MRSLACLVLLAHVAILALPATMAHADETAATIGPPLVLETRDELVEARVALPRAAETDPVLFRHVIARARAELDAFRAEAAAARGDETVDPAYPWRPWSLDVTFEEHLADTRFASLLISRFVYTGGAHPGTEFEALNLDLESGGELSLADLFADTAPGAPALRAMARFVREDLLRQKRERFGEASPDELDGVAPTGETFSTFTLEPAREPDLIAGLTIHFEPYMVGSYAEGPYAVYVPADVFRDHLAERYAGTFGGTAVRFQRLTTYRAPGVLVLLQAPREDARVAPPLVISGEAPDYWFDEGSAGVRLETEDGKRVAEGYVTADPASRTSRIAAGMVAFSGEFTFDPPAADTGVLVLAPGREASAADASAASVRVSVRFR